MTNSAQHPVFEDELMVLRHADFCSLPGYLILRFNNGALSLGDLDPDEASRFGALISAAVAAIESATGADRVYCICLAELDRNLHFHLLPRTSQLLADYHQATATGDQPTNGALLFEWAREAFPAGQIPPPGYPDREAVCAAIRSLLDKNLEHQKS